MEWGIYKGGGTGGRTATDGDSAHKWRQTRSHIAALKDKDKYHHSTAALRALCEGEQMPSLHALNGRLMIAVVHDIDIEVYIDVEVCDVEAVRVILLQLFGLIVNDHRVDTVRSGKIRRFPP